MGYGGGTVTQPILGGFDEVGKLMLQGLAQTSAIVMENEKRRADEINRLSDIAGKIAATGVQDYDKVIHNAASLNANQLATAQNDLRAGKINMGEFSQIKSQLFKNNTLLANDSKLMDTNMKNVIKGVDDEDYDSISIDLQNMLSVNDPHEKQEIFKARAVDAKGEPKVDNNGNPIFITRVANEATTIQLGLDNDMYRVKYKEVQKVDSDGNPIFDADGIPETEVKEFRMKLSDYLSPSLKKIDYFNVGDEVKEFQSIKGKRARYVDSLTGVELTAPYEQLAHFSSGTKVMGYALAEQDFPDMIADVETDVRGLSNDDMISILHSHIGARADWQPDYKGPRPLDEVNSDDSIYFNITVAGEKIQVPQFYDKDGEVIGEFTFDPMVLQTGADGKIHLTDEQKTIAQAFYRRKLHHSFNVNYVEYKDYLQSRKTSSTKVPPKVDFTTSNYVKKNQDGTINRSAGIDGQYLRNKISIAAGYISDIDGDMESNLGSNLLAQHQRGDKIESTAKLTPQQALLSERAPNVLGGVNLTYMSTPTKSGDAILNYVTQDIKGTTVTGGKLKSLGQIMVFDEGVDKDGEDTPIMVVLSGEVDLGKTSIAASEQVIGGTAGVQRSRTISAEDFYIVESATELNSLYKMLWRQGDSPNSFKTILESKGYNIDGKKAGGQKDMLQAFKEYMNEIKTR